MAGATRRAHPVDAPAHELAHRALEVGANQVRAIEDRNAVNHRRIAVVDETNVQTWPSPRNGWQGLETMRLEEHDVLAHLPVRVRPDAVLASDLEPMQEVLLISERMDRDVSAIRASRHTLGRMLRPPLEVAPAAFPVAGVDRHRDGELSRGPRRGTRGRARARSPGFPRRRRCRAARSPRSSASAGGSRRTSRRSGRCGRRDCRRFRFHAGA